jgi:hypothetical protein
MVKIYGIASGIIKAHDVSLQEITPYQYNITSSPTPQPAISVYCSGILTNFTDTISQYPDGLIKLYACAVPTGVVGPTDALQLISGYIGDRPTFIDVSGSIYPTGSICTITRRSIPTTEGPNVAIPISGNAYYDLYATHVLTAKVNNRKNTIVGYGDMVSLSGVISRAPFPNINDANKSIGEGVIDDTGEKTNTGDMYLTQFDFPFGDAGNTTSLFANLNSFAHPLYPIRMSCSGVSSGYYFPASYDGTNESATPVYQYCMKDEAISWLVPKFNINGSTYADYKFDISYINLSGHVTGPLTVSYTSDTLKDIETKTFTLNEATQEQDISEPNFNILIEGTTGRHRLAVGVNDIDLVTVQYNEKGTYVSAPFTSEKPIYAISMETNESSLGFAGHKIENIVKYYIQFTLSNDGEWYPISPKPRSNEVDTEGKLVPNIYILDTNLFEEDKVIDLYNQVAFINLDKELYNFRIKIEMDAISTGFRGRFTPQIFDYRVSVIDRAALASSNFERYLFN